MTLHDEEFEKRNRPVEKKSKRGLSFKMQEKKEKIDNRSEIEKQAAVLLQTEGVSYMEMKNRKEKEQVKKDRKDRLNDAVNTKTTELQHNLDLYRNITESNFRGDALGDHLTRDLYVIKED
tara:strand:- start:364 stop:726 length:363 start_codon:yes stop_codon:yes gene_type:complete